MKIISLSYEDAGYACSIGTSIKKKYNQQTNFFDFLVVDMRTINHIITLKDLNLLTQNFKFEDQTKKENKTLIWNHFSKMISYHDLKSNFNEESLKEFTNKYLRRYYRLMNDLYNEEKLFFIRYGKTNINDVKLLIQNIKNIKNINQNQNQNQKIFFINIDFDKNNKENIFYPELKNYIYINFCQVNKKDLNNDDIYFKLLECNWEYVFQKIEELSK
jgi:hypothetical protein